MRKYIAILSLAALMLISATASADNGKGKSKDKSRKDEVRAELRSEIKAGLLKLKESRFSVLGTVKSKAASSMVITLENSALKGFKGQDVSILVDSNTKFDLPGDTDNFASLKVGDKVNLKVNVKIADPLTTPSETGNTVSAKITLTASKIKVMTADNDDDGDDNSSPADTQTTFGSIVAKTDNSITIKDNLTGVSKVLTVDSNTQVKINDQAKTIADVQVGDRGWVRFKTTVDNLVAKVINLFR